MAEPITWADMALRPAAALASAAYLAIEVLMSTPHSVVVSARVQLACEAAWRDIELVVPRRRCQGERPACDALMEAAFHGIRRLQGAGRRRRLRVVHLKARVDGRWQALLEQGKALVAPVVLQAAQG